MKNHYTPNQDFWLESSGNALCGLDGRKQPPYNFRVSKTTPDFPFDLDIFCQVIDHFGDAGVALRLARGLCARPEIGRVRLFCSDLPLLRQIAGVASPGDPELASWESGARAAPAPVVVAAFGCDLPEPYLSCAKRTSRLVIHLDYLSAEPWVIGMHGLPSPYPDSPLPRYFFMPGFLPGSGGVLGQRPAPRIRPVRGAGPLRLLYYVYGDFDGRPLFSALDARGQPWVAVAPAGEGQRGLEIQLPAAGFSRRGRVWRRGLGTVVFPPFLAQRPFDALIHWADVALVRGEDSAAQAIMSGRAVAWQLYRQPRETRRAKLDAFLAAASPFLIRPEAAAAFHAFHLWLNGLGEAGPGGAEGLFSRYLAQRQAIAAAMAEWATALETRCNLLDSMVYFILQQFEGVSPK